MLKTADERYKDITIQRYNAINAVYTGICICNRADTGIFVRKKAKTEKYV